MCVHACVCETISTVKIVKIFIPFPRFPCAHLDFPLLTLPKHSPLSRAVDLLI